MNLCVCVCIYMYVCILIGCHVLQERLLHFYFVFKVLPVRLKFRTVNIVLTENVFRCL